MHRGLVLGAGRARHRVERPRARRALQPAAQLAIARGPLHRRRLERPHPVAAVGVEAATEVVAHHRLAPLAHELAPPPVVGQLLLVGQRHRAGLLEQVAPGAVDDARVRRVRAGPRQARARRGRRRRGLDDRLLRGGDGQRGERPEHGHLCAGHRVEQGDDEHRHRPDQHADAQAERGADAQARPRRRGRATARARVRPRTAERAVESGIHDGCSDGPALGSGAEVHVDRHHAVTWCEGSSGGRRDASTGRRPAANDPVSPGRGTVARVRPRCGGTSGRAARECGE